MIDLPPSLQEHLAQDATTLCYAWIVERSDTVKMGFTDHDHVLNIEGVLCDPSTGLTASAIENSAGLAGDTTDAAGILSSDKISADDIEAGRYDGAKVFQYLVNWAAPDETALLRRYFVGEITQEDDAFRVELRSFSSALDQVDGRYFLRSCDAILGDQKCGVDLGDSAFRASGVVSQSNLPSQRTIVASMPFDFPKQWFSAGKLIWTSGDLIGQEYEVADAQRTQIGGDVNISLVQAMRTVPKAGDSFDLIAGCDKRFETCKAKFANSINFRGFPHMPGNDTALNYADSDSEYKGDPLVP